MNNALPTPPKPGLKLLNAGFSLNEQALLYPAGDRARPSSTSATSSFIYSRRLLPAPSERGGRPADSRRRRVARGFLPAPGRGRRPPRAAPARRPAAAAGRRTERPFPGFRRPTRHVRPGSPGTAGSRPGARHCPAGNTAVAVACPHRPGPAAPGTARRAAVRRQTAARPAEAPPPRLEGRGAAPLRAPSLPPHPPALPGPPRLTLPHSQPVSFLISSISSSRSSVDAREPIAAPGPERKGRAAARCRGELRSRRATAVPQPPPPQHGPDRGRPALLRGRPSPHRLLSPRPPRPVPSGPALTARLTPPLSRRAPAEADPRACAQHALPKAQASSSLGGHYSRGRGGPTAPSRAGRLWPPSGNFPSVIGCGLRWLRPRGVGGASLAVCRRCLAGGASFPPSRAAVWPSAASASVPLWGEPLKSP